MAAAHARVLDAVYEILQERPAREMTMEMVARRAGVGKPTLYKWWPTRASLMLGMFTERLHETRQPAEADSAERAIRNRVQRLIVEFNGLFGKVMAGLIAEGQSDPAVLHELYNQHILPSRNATVAEIVRGMATGEFSPDNDPALVVDTIFSPLYFRLLLQGEPLTELYGDALVSQALRNLTTSEVPF